jgi:predicted Zn-dependent protease
MHQEGVSDLEMRAALDGVSEMLRLGCVDRLIDIIELGIWRNAGYSNTDGSLKPHQSIDWYLHEGALPHLKGERRKNVLGDDQLLTSQVIGFFQDLPECEKNHYPLIVCNEDLNIDWYGCEYISGQGEIDVGAICSVLRIRQGGFDPGTHYECVKTLVMHELGHTFGAIDPERENLDLASGPHCKNKCVMRRGAPQPITHWAEKSKDRLESGALCKECYESMVNYFHKR